MGSLNDQILGADKVQIHLICFEKSDRNFIKGEVFFFFLDESFPALYAQHYAKVV